MLSNLDPGSSTPLYRQLKEALRAGIKNGEFPPGARIPSEARLAEAYGVSLITVRGAVAELVEENLLTRRQGKGTYVTSSKIARNVQVFMGFSESCEAAGHNASARVLGTTVEPAAERLLRALELPAGAQVIRIGRLRAIDGLPAAVEYNYFSTSFDFLLREPLEGSLYQALRSHGAYPTHGRRTISICRANRETAGLLELSRGAPLLLIDDLVRDDQFRPLHFCTQMIRSDRYELVVEL